VAGSEEGAAPRPSASETRGRPPAAPLQVYGNAAGLAQQQQQQQQQQQKQQLLQPCFMSVPVLQPTSAGQGQGQGQYVVMQLPVLNSGQAWQLGQPGEAKGKVRGWTAHGVGVHVLVTVGVHVCMWVCGCVCL